MNSTPEDQRRSVTIEEHAHFLRSLTTDERGRDAIDREIGDMPLVDPYEVHAPRRRSDKDLGRMLDLLDNLPTGNDRKDTTK